MPETTPATMSVAFLFPVFDGLMRCGMTEQQLAAQLDLSLQMLRDPAVTIPANKVYGFLAWSTSQSKDPHFCAHVGQDMGKGNWAPVVPLMVEAKTVGDFFQRFSHLASKQGRAASYRLEVEGPVALWKLMRATGASEAAVFADAMATGFFVEVLKRAANLDWAPSQCIAVIGDPALVPSELLPQTSVLSGDVGLKLRFPATCLSLDMPEVSKTNTATQVQIPTPKELTLESRVRLAITQRISDPNLDIQKLADAIGLSKWKLQTGLAAEGTNVLAIKDEVRQNEALRLVRSSNAPVFTIASKLGYANSANFARAFKAWTGVSPREFRRMQLAQG
ncbi:AraC family transcriptional regulator [Shimia sp. Alg240-R146]|uniref:AraC family transcriptional regulator n=1 Tax=Shimia sp. Alg240-R146 TaxID=2993449 RepID=UPI0022E07E86|nr:AraC family transcriptional regulator [Shimia sp. Alg240-R146]